MALGELISEWKGKITATKVHPFDSSGQEVTIEQAILGEQTGRLSGREMGAAYVTLAPDGTTVGTYYGVLTTTDGETVRVESRGMGAPLSPGRSRVQVTVTLRTTSPKLAWVNTTIAAFEGEVNDAEMGIAGRIYGWK